MEQQLGILVRKPLSILNKNINFNFEKFFKGLSKSVISLKAGSLERAGLSFMDAVSAIGFEEDPGQVAWLLVYRSLVQAIYSLVEENKESLSPTIDDIDFMCEQLDLTLENKEFVLKVDFFEKPKEMSILEEIKKPLSEWLNCFGLDSSQSQAICNRLPSYFVFALNDQWRKRQNEYKCLKEQLDTPFTKATEREQSWKIYSSWLSMQIDEPLFIESFSLSQVYVPLRAYYEKKAPKREQDNKFEKNTVRKMVVDLEDELEEWLLRSDRHDAIRVISGGPGSGKSSFAKIFAAKQSERGRTPVLFIPLHHFELSADLIESVGEFVKYDGFFTYNPLDLENGEKKLLLFLMV